jgi:hypothetical protein
MTDLPDEMQREFEVKPGVKQITFTVLWVDKGQRYTHVQVYPLARILGALKKWHQKVADSDETPRCLICDTGLLQDTGQNPKAFVVGFSDTKIRVPGRTATHRARMRRLR